MIDWSNVFEDAQPEPPASEAEIARLQATLGLPLSPAELDRVNRSQSNPWPPGDAQHAQWRPFDPSAWRMPARPLPPSYLSFLRWSNGGTFTNGGRLFQMYGDGLREMLLCYNVPQYMPGAVPFAMNGGGVFYMLDMREDAIDGEYPILAVHAGSLTFDPHYAPRIAGSFPEACRGRFDVRRLLHGGVVLDAGSWATCRDPKPMLDEVEDRPRKLRLFACACVRRVWADLTDVRFRNAVEVAERFAEGAATDKERAAAKKKAEAAHGTPVWTTAAAAAANCASTDAAGAAWNAAICAAGVEGDYQSDAWNAARARQADLIREIFGDPFRPKVIDPSWLAWNGGAVAAVARSIHETGRFADMPVLADALEEAGCADADILAHCRRADGHVRGCWVVDLLLGKR